MHDLTHAVRRLRSNPSFTLVAVATLSLGLGATTAVFSVVNSVLLQPLPFDRPHELIRVRFTQDGRAAGAAPSELADFRANTRRFEGLALSTAGTFSVVRDGVDPIRVTGARVSANWFELLRVRPLHGRFFTATEDDQPFTPVAVISERLWRRHFSADTAIVGKTIRVNSRPFILVGIVPAGQAYPLAAELWAPLGFTAAQLNQPVGTGDWMAMLGRVKPGTDIALAAAELNGLTSRTEHRRAAAVELRDFTTGDVRKPLLILLGAVALVLLIACANVANLMLVRANAREGEVAIRTALGASRARLIREALTESLLVSTLGAVGGLILAVWGTSALLALAPADLPRANEAGIDGPVLAVATGIALLTGIVFGVLPIVQGGAMLGATLRAGGRGIRGTNAGSRLRRAVVTAEVALAVVLVTGSALLMRSFSRLVSVETGFAGEQVQTMAVNLPGRTYDSMPKVRTLIDALEQRLSALPGVRAAAVASSVPLDGNGGSHAFVIRGRAEPREGDEPRTQTHQVTSDYFDALGIRVLRGRAFTGDDRPGTMPAVIVSQAFVTRYFPDEDPLGKQVNLRWRVEGERQGGVIVGVVGDVRGAGLERAAEPALYLPLVQSPATELVIAVRTVTDPAAITSSVRAVVRDLDAELPVFDVRTMEERVAAYVGPQRFYATMAGAFGAIALTLAAVGVYGVIAYAVGQRRHEFGVRMALGATSNGISRMVLNEGLRIAALGLVIGVTVSLAGARVLASLLYEVGVTDPLAFAGGAAVLAIVTTLASYLPARRAGRVDPLVALRSE